MFQGAGALVRNCLNCAEVAAKHFVPLDPPLQLRGVFCARLTDGSTALHRGSLPAYTSPRPPKSSPTPQSSCLSKHSPPAAEAPPQRTGSRGNGGKQRRGDFRVGGSSWEGPTTRADSDATSRIGRREAQLGADAPKPAVVATATEPTAQLDLLLSRMGISREYGSAEGALEAQQSLQDSTSTFDSGQDTVDSCRRALSAGAASSIDTCGSSALALPIPESSSDILQVRRMGLSDGLGSLLTDQHCTEISLTGTCFIRQAFPVSRL